MKTYFWKSLRKEKTNTFGACAVFSLLFISLQLLFAEAANIGNETFFYPKSYREDCYYAAYNKSGRLLYNVPLEDQGLVKETLDTKASDTSLVYIVECTEACVKKQLGFVLTDRAYLLGKKAPDDFVYPSTPYAVEIGNVFDSKDTYEKDKITYPVALRLGMEKNPPIEERLQNIGYKEYGLVALINPKEDIYSEYVRANACVLGNSNECKLNNFTSGADLNAQIQMGRTLLPNGIYAGLLIPALIEALAFFSFLSYMQRKERDEIFALRLSGAKRSQCFGLSFGRRALEALFGYLLSAILFFPWLIPLSSAAPTMFYVGQSVAILYVLLILLLRTNKETKWAFYHKHPRKEENDD